MNRSSTLESRLAQKAAVVEQALDVLLPAAPAFPAMIHEAMRYSALGGGKRLRGVLVMEAGLVCGGSDAFERDVSGCPAPSVHLDGPRACATWAPCERRPPPSRWFTPIRSSTDDLPCMDDDDLRRGKRRTTGCYGEGHRRVGRWTRCLTRAFEVLTRLSWAGRRDQVAVGVIAELAMAGGTGGLIGGQVVRP